jgi:ribonuclease BN (tRNA processing enzyme)
MRVTIVGCSGSLAGPRSPASCYLVQAEYEGRTWNLLLDLGSGSLGALQRQINPMAIDTVLLSHLHPDHCLDLCGLYVMRKHGPDSASFDPRIPVYGPRLTGERMARAYDLAPGDGMHGELDFRDLAGSRTLRIGPFTVTPQLVNHPVEAYGFRVEADGRVLAYTGDTDTCQALEPLFHDADLVLADSAFVDGRDAAQGVHLSGSRAAQAAVDAGGVRRLMLTHLPPWNDPCVCRAQAGAVWPGEVELAEADARHEL